MKRKIITLISIIVLSSLHTVASQDSIYLKILNQNYPALDSQDRGFNSENYREYLLWAFHNQLNLWQDYKRKIIFSLFDKYAKKDLNSESTVFNDPISWKDLTLFCGQKDVKIYLADKLDRTVTALGSATLYSMLAQPLCDCAALEKRQALIKGLCANEKLYTSLKNELEAFKRHENVILSYFGPQDFFKSIAARRYFSYCSKSMNDALNKNAYALNIRNSVDHIQRITCAASTLIAMPLLPICGIAQIAGFELPDVMHHAGENLRGSGIPFISLLTALISKPAVLGSLSLISSVICILNCKETFEWMADNFLLDTLVQARIMHVARTLEAIQKIENSILSNDVLHNNLEKWSALRSIRLSAHEDIKKLFSLLKSDDFNNSPSLSTNKGNIFVAYKLFADNKEYFEDSLLALGEIDAYFSIATLYKELKQQNAPCCFAHYLQADIPCLALEEFWNPFLNPQKAISNSLHLDTCHNKRNMIITGPNAGGKSTLLKAVAINIILAQSFGIVCAKKAELTPFHKILTYLNIADDIGAGNSLFKAQVLRAQNIIDTIKELKKNEFSFAIIDEMFNGTSPQEAQACAYSVAKNIARYNNNISIIATHFSALTHLEKETTAFHNYHVSVDRLRMGCISYPFKLQRGISDQHVALDILKAEGFEGSIIDDATSVLRAL